MNVKIHKFVQTCASLNGGFRDAHLFSVSKQNYWKRKAESKNFRMIVVVVLLDLSALSRIEFQ